MAGAGRKEQKYEQILEYADRSVSDFVVKRGLDSYGVNTSKVDILKLLFPTLSPKTDFELLGRAVDGDMDIIITASIIVIDKTVNILGTISSDL